MQLYKYVTAETFSNIMEDGTLRVSGVNDFNDIFDCALPPIPENFEENACLKYKEMFKSPVSEKTKTDYVINKLLKDAEKGVDSLAEHLASLAVDVYHLSHSMMDDVWEDVKNNLKILCFSECDNSAYMWGHYADSNRGVKLRIDTDKLCRNAYPQQIIYRDDVSWFENDFLYLTLLYKYAGTDIINDEENKKKIRAHLVELFGANALVKKTEWEKEKEWRIIFTDKDDKPIIHKSEMDFIKLPKDALIDVVLGVNYDSNNNSAIENLFRSYPYTRVFQARVINGKVEQHTNELLGFVD